LLNTLSSTSIMNAPTCRVCEVIQYCTKLRGTWVGCVLGG
jgi:hypothetical protein